MSYLSVVMTTYNENISYLRMCIDSVLQQTYKEFELNIITEVDETNMDYIKSLTSKDSRVKVFRNTTNLGIAGSRNVAIKGSSGEYIAFIDGDDYCCSNRFEKQLKFLENNPRISVVGSNMHLIDGDNNIIGERKYPETYKDIKRNFLLTMSIGNPTVIVRRKDIEEIGYFNDSFTKAEDFELWLRFLAKDKKMYSLQENLLYYRVPTKSNIKRSRIHWKNNYIARKRFGKFIWPLHKRFLSLVFFLIISCIPDIFLRNLPNMRILNKIRKIKIF